MSNYRTVARQEVDKTAWDAASASFEQAWFWHQWDVIEAFSSWNAAEDHSFAIADDAQDGQLVCICPLLWFPGRAPVSRLLSRLESTGGPAVDEKLSKRQVTKVYALVQQTLMAIAERTGAYRVDLSFSPLAPAMIAPNSARINPAVNLAYKESSTHTWIVDLQGEDNDTLWMKLDQRVRKTVNKARKLGGEVRRATLDDLPLYMDIHERSCVRLGIAPKPEAYFKAILGDLQNSGSAIAFVGSLADGMPLTVHTFALAKDAALYWTVASDEAVMDTGLNSLVQWEAMQHFLKTGTRFYETGEAFPALKQGKLKQISDFKKGFGAKLYPYFRGEMLRKPVLAAFLNLLKALTGRDNRIQ